MELKEALDMLDQLCATAQSNREGHVAMQQAIQVVTEATKPKKESDGNK